MAKKASLGDCANGINSRWPLLRKRTIAPTV
ncbi:MAG: hypothetical protein ACI9H8_001225, partial [Lysobacterales bacterium]